MASYTRCQLPYYQTIFRSLLDVLSAIVGFIMPRSTSLAAYSLKVWNYEETESEIISDFGDEEDLLEVFSELLSSLQAKASHDKHNRQLLTVETLKIDNKARTICGIIETGEYGSESKLRDADTQQIVYKRKIKEADMLPFYFLFDLPEGSEDGILVLQRTGMFGIRKVLTTVIESWFNPKFPDFGLRFHPLAEPGDLEKYKEGQVETIRFIGYDVPSDIADALKSHNKQFDGHVELVISARRGSFLPVKERIRRFFNKEVELNKFIALKETKFKYQDVKLKTKVGRSRRTVSLGGLKLLRSYYDITDDVTMDGATGHPAFESIDGLAKGLASRVRKSMGIPDVEE